MATHFEIIRYLCTPYKPHDISYEGLKTLLLNYVNPKPDTITERYKFKKQLFNNCYNA